MIREIAVAVTSWLMCLCFTSCALVRYKDAGAPFQAGEEYFAVGAEHLRNAQKAMDPDDRAKEFSLSIDAYRKAILAYREVVDKYPDSEYAPEALYAMAASNAYIAEALTDDSAKQEKLSRMNAAYKELSEKYPQSKHAAEASLSVGNDYSNQASAQDLSTEERTDLHKLALGSYRRALRVPGIEDKTRATVETYVKHLTDLLARDIYNAGAALVPFEADLEKKKANAPKAIPYFREVIEKCPDTDYADLSYVQLGLCYEYLERWDDAAKMYEELIQKYTDENGNPITPFSENIIQALKFARERLGKLRILDELIAFRAYPKSPSIECVVYRNQDFLDKL